MIEPTHIVGLGRAATEALAATIAGAKQAGPLAPVTVVVPSNFVGLSARRLLGSNQLAGTGRGGIANVGFVTPFQLAELVGADLCLDSRPITNPVLGAAVRRALATDPGPYRPVADHEATEAALAALFAELSNVDEAGLESIEELDATSAKLAVHFHRVIAANLDGFHTEHQLVGAVADRSGLAERLVSFGHIVWYLPAPLRPALARFVDRVLHDATSSSVIVGLTGDADADEGVWRSCEAAGVVRPHRYPSPAPVSAGSVVSVTDAPEEVRVVAGRILDLAEQGVSLHRIGVFYPAPDPYVRIIEQQFAASNIVANGPDHRRLRDSVAGRTLLAALALPSTRWRRDRVMALVAGAPVHAGGEPTRPTTWDDLSREAGVVRDLSDWHDKLGRARDTAVSALADLADPTGTDAWRARRLRDRRADLERLRSFVAELGAQVRSVDQAPSWATKAEAAQGLLVWLLGPESLHSHWPEAEQDAFERVEAALVRLAALDSIEPTPSFAVFQRALRAELDVARGRRGRFGQGVLYGPLSSAFGHDLDAVFVLGAAEGLLPVARRDDPVLPDEIRIASMESLRTRAPRLSDDIRIASIDQLDTKATRLEHQHRAFLAALAAAPAAAATVTFARGDLRSGRRALPSRWLLASIAQQARRPVHATDFDSLDPSLVEVIGSHASGLLADGWAATADDRDLAIIARHVAAGGDAIEHPLALDARSGLALQRARTGAEFTEFDGNLGAVATPMTGDRPISPTRLETWAGCGFRYFLGHILDLTDRDDPERIDDISPLDRGSLLHQILERFIAEAIAVGPPPPDQPWSAAQRARLHELADEAFLDVEERGRTGRAIHWQVRRDDLRDRLDQFLDLDDRFRASYGATPIEVELDFGVRSGVPLELDLPSGRTLALRGMADRVDSTVDGRVVVSDYKSGKGAKYDKLDEDPVRAGTALQLGLYAEAALRHTGHERAEAAYWLVEAPPGKHRRGYPWIDDHRTRFLDVVDTIVEGIDSGVFAAAPGEWDTFRQTNSSCAFCPFDSVCVRDRGEHAIAKATHLIPVRARLGVVDDDDAGFDPGADE